MKNLDDVINAIQSDIDHSYRWVMGVFAFMGGTAVISFATYVYDEAVLGKQVISERDVGAALAAEYFPEQKIGIETDKGFFLVLGQPSVLRGTRFVAQERANGSKFLCERHDQARCWKLVG